MRTSSISIALAMGSAGLAGAFLAISTPAASQSDKMAPLPAQLPAATIYRDAGYSGPAVAV
ncbi:hypothetical protein ACFFF7_14995 [Novosphingobium aquiterrae]|uniref:Uncharacterized protein n=1 Tax=Novosphingobium aquiterrae TaxID=624388 RepID=A0ABV6PLL3_9SPHN